MIPVGTPVQYVGHENVPMAATVTMTAATYQADSDPHSQFAPADEDSVSLAIYRPVSGRTYARHNVPMEGSPAHAALVAKEAAEAAAGPADVAETDEDAEDHTAPAKTTVVRFWRPVQ